MMHDVFQKLYAEVLKNDILEENQIPYSKIEKSIAWENLQDHEERANKTRVINEARGLGRELQFSNEVARRRVSIGSVVCKNH